MRIKLRIHYFLIGVKDAFRLWHIRAILFLMIASIACCVAAYYLQENLFVNSVLMSCSTGLITGIILYVVEQLKTSQNYMLSQNKESFSNELKKVKQLHDEVLYQYMQRGYPRSEDIEKLKKCTQPELDRVVLALKIVVAVDYDKFLLPINYTSKERNSIMDKVKFIQDNISRVSTLIELSYGKNDMGSLYDALLDLRHMIDSFEDLYGEIFVAFNKYGQLEYLMNSKFL